MSENENNVKSRDRNDHEEIDDDDDDEIQNEILSDDVDCLHEFPYKHLWLKGSQFKLDINNTINKPGVGVCARFVIE